MLEPAYNFLQNHLWQEENTEDDFQAILTTGKFVLQIANEDPSVLQRLMDPTLEVCILIFTFSRKVITFFK